ncbi:hypothetical protein GON03_05550 [Nocardioides sp. MAH-18]|uniref:Uncharacterized protein n=1 Tax=Nocardioides agri TaxID=2682843 RepID=A0A6L6XNX3_9ACTN|nr:MULTISPECIES: hypothetical protein [unclassified Nocardioides]MBA2953773.1 hypothetical protein [Nocardioides sp. CGMCC 1.13656]MVQ48638.1 hypothetical protein [Nocardioides sp. MAH-18]
MSEHSNEFENHYPITEDGATFEYDATYFESDWDATQATDELVEIARNHGLGPQHFAAEVEHGCRTMAESVAANTFDGETAEELAEYWVLVRADASSLAEQINSYGLSEQFAFLSIYARAELEDLVGYFVKEAEKRAA